ncbi:MAG: hypothetical protein K2L21_02745 [Muribaculaceae bacterium]|nr:hypothetical protein [Muribaculaceae bacterium]
MFQDLYNSHYCLTAGETDAHGLLSAPMLVQKCIEIATRHANALRIGYEELSSAGIGWVLSRMSIEIERYPRINETFSIYTWIESYNRHFSDRMFEVVDEGGNTLARARSTWVAIDMQSRTMADLLAFERDAFPCLDRPCDVAPAARVGKLGEAAEEEPLHFGYSDIDFNRHVNTVRYLERLLDHWPLEHHDHYAVARLDMTFNHELLYGTPATLRVEQHDHTTDCEITGPGGRRAAAFRIRWRLRRDME